MALKIHNYDSKPERFQAVEVTEANFQEIAAWIGASTVEANKDLVTGRVSVRYYIRQEEGADYSVRVTVGQWVGRNPEGRYFETNKTVLDANFDPKD